MTSGSFCCAILTAACSYIVNRPPEAVRGDAGNESAVVDAHFAPRQPISRSSGSLWRATKQPCFPPYSAYIKPADPEYSEPAGQHHPMLFVGGSQEQPGTEPALPTATLSPLSPRPQTACPRGHPTASAHWYQTLHQLLHATQDAARGIHSNHSKGYIEI